MMYKLRSLLIFLILLIPLGIIGQENYASNIRTDTTNSQKMLIKYDLIAPLSGAMFNVSLSLSANGKNVKYSSAMMGDFGNLTTAGRDKAIVWYYMMDGFEGNIEDIEVSITAALIAIPTADFSFEIVGSKLPYKVVFSNKSQNADELSWNFDDPGSGPNNLSQLERPEHTYLRARAYSVSLLVKSVETGLSDSITKLVELNRGELPTADYKYKLSSKVAPSTGWFRSLADNAHEYSWSFGDPDSGNNNSSAKKNPVHVFNKPGTYHVVLTVTNTTSKEKHSHNKDILISGSNK